MLKKEKLISFNSIKGTIKTKLAGDTPKTTRSFNSIKGTIKTLEPDQLNACGNGFQFHKRYD